MISRLRGKVLHKDFEGAVIDVHGLGFRVAIPMTSLERLPGVGEEADLHTWLSVREDALELFGFTEEADRKVFVKLISVSGVGPKMGLSFLSGMTGAEVVAAILRNDIRGLCAIKGVGKKTAERLVLELKDAMGKIDLGASGSMAMAGSLQAALSQRGPLEDLRSALSNLGYPPATTDRAVAEVQAMGEGLSFNEMLRAALKVVRG